MFVLLYNLWAKGDEQEVKSNESCKQTRWNLTALDFAHRVFSFTAFDIELQGSLT